MQQTETYKLNLIESSDPFLPNALNENTRKIEEVVQEKLGEMDARVTVLECHKVATGCYFGNSYDTTTLQTITVGFTPEWVLIQMWDRGLVTALKDYANDQLKILENGFQVRGNWNNNSGAKYFYIAIA